ncbi:TetR/AcrR family transcriptional regulator [Brachybacterium sp. DNPG3]
MTTADPGDPGAGRPRRRPGRPRGQDSAVVRDAALRAAVELIGTQGYTATSMAQVAAAAGISPSGLAHHFPSKPALLAAVLEHRDQTDRLDDELARHGGWDALEALIRLAGTNMRRRELVALYTSVIGEAVQPEHPGHGWMRDHFAHAAELLESALRTGQERGEVRADAPVGRIVRTLIAQMDGLQVQWLLDPTIDMEADLRELVDDIRHRWASPQ